MPVIFAPRNAGAPPSVLTGIGAALETAFKAHQYTKDRDRELKLREQRAQAEAEDRKSRAEYRTFQMDQGRRTAAS